MSRPIKHLKISGYKSLKNVDLELKNLNVLIGANGVGKSNLVSYFRLLSAILDRKLQIFVSQQGGARDFFVMELNILMQYQQRCILGIMVIF